MILPLLMWLSNPITWMIVMMLVASGARAVRSGRHNHEHGSHIVRIGNGVPAAATVALMFLSTTYRPSVEFAAKAQIQQQEAADDDEQGGPDSPKRHFNRQLRRICNGENVDRLVWRLG